MQWYVPFFLVIGFSVVALSGGAAVTSRRNRSVSNALLPAGATAVMLGVTVLALDVMIRNVGEVALMTGVLGVPILGAVLGMFAISLAERPELDDDGWGDA